MNTTLTKLEGLNRQLVVEVPIADFNAQTDKVLNDLKGKVKIDGFRQGKIPLSVIKQKYGSNVETDAANDLIGELLPKVFIQEKLTPAGQPTLNKIDFENSEVFSFTVEFEVFSEIKLKDLSELKIEKTTCTLSQEDKDKTIEGLKEQAAEFETVERASENSDRLKINFKGFVNGETFQGGEAKDFALILGKGSMIPGFEEGLVGKKAGEKVTIDINFPDNYQSKDLAGKAVKFEVDVNLVEQNKGVEVNDEFAKKFGKNNVAELLAGIEEQMQIQVTERLEQLNKDATFLAVIAANELDVPKTSVESEAKHLLEDMNNRMKQQGMPDNNAKLDASVFNDEATRRVKLGLLVGEITAKNNIKATDEQIDNKLKAVSAQYGEQAQQMIDYYKSNPEALSGIRSMVVETLASDFIMQQAQITEVEKKFSEIIVN